MSRSFTTSGNEKLSINSGLGITAEPWSIAGWAYANEDVATIQRVFGLKNSSSDDGFYMRFRGDVGGDPLQLYIQDTGIVSDTVLAGNPGFNSWFHWGCVFTSTSNRTAYLDGSGTNSTKSVTGMDSPDYFELSESVSRPWGGYLAEVGAWNVSLTAAEFGVLTLGYSPLLVRPASLIAYWHLIGRTSPEVDRVGGYDLALTNSPGTAAHPRVIMPESKHIIAPAELSPIGQKFILPPYRPIIS
jgi:hypothetical protein